jgi:hypothetical protein
MTASRHQRLARTGNHWDACARFRSRVMGVHFRVVGACLYGCSGF